MKIIRDEKSRDTVPLMHHEIISSCSHTTMLQYIHYNQNLFNIILKKLCLINELFQRKFKMIIAMQILPIKNSSSDLQYVATHLGYLGYCN
jgi:hypothetical protein